MDRRSSAHIIAKTLGIIMVIAISACHTEATRFPAKKAHSITTETDCMPDKYTHLIGQDKSALDTLKLPARARIIGPDTMVTMDYSAERLNVHHNKAGKVIKFTCG